MSDALGSNRQRSRDITIRDLLPADEAGWRRLWDGYNAFYETAVAPEITARTWDRILDPASSVFGRLAEADGSSVGFSLSIIHEGTWVPDRVCYLEDLYVDPICRGRGIGRRLIQDLIEQGRERGWATLYWHTRRDNPGRRLYDEFITADDFVRYRLPL